MWIILLGFYIPAISARLSPGATLLPEGPLRFAHVFAIPFFELALLAWLAPWAWRWTGRSQDFPGPWRGILQGLILGAALGMLVLLMEDHLLNWVMSRTPVAWWKVVRSIPQLAIGLCFVGFLIVALDKTTLAKERAEQMAREAQWILLRGQMNPHVFFNAMNNLTELIRKDQQLAERAAMDLSDLFRRLMDHGQCHVAPLGEERALVERYLAIEGLRLGSRIQVEWAWDEALDVVEAPPFLLQPLVENAIKHGLAPVLEGGSLQITGRIEKGRAWVRVANTGRPLKSQRIGGSGLANLEARLGLAFEGEASFHLASNGAWTVAEIAFPVPQVVP
jgi:hypothetical protein